MNHLKESIAFAPELKDQLDLLHITLHEENHLTPENRKIVAWATAMASQNKKLVEFTASETDNLTVDEKKIVTLASSRMAVTNPYFMSRNVFPLQSGGTLKSINLRPFQELNIDNEVGYHYACIAISSVNNGFLCFNSHMTSLQSLSEKDDAIDQALRIVSAILSIKQIMFNVEISSLH
jgi:hypothetical protein